MRARLYPVPLLIGGREVDPFTAGAVKTRNGRWLLLYPDPITDSEKFCEFHLEKQWGRYGHWERPDEFVEALDSLIHHLWLMEKRFDPERNDSFGNYARTYIRRRAIDVGPRRLLGRNGSRLADYLHDELDEAYPGHGEPDPLQPGDVPDDRHAPLGRVQGPGDRDAARLLTRVRRAAARAAA